MTCAFLPIGTGNFTMERDDLTRRLNNITMERDDLTRRLNDITMERDDLRRRLNYITIATIVVGVAAVIFLLSTVVLAGIVIYLCLHKVQ